VLARELPFEEYLLASREHGTSTGEYQGFEFFLVIEAMRT
jgi:hypothetical protein